MKNSRRKIGCSLCLFLLLSMIVALFTLPSVMASVAISSMNPTSGNVGTSVQLSGNITTSGGAFEVLFDEVTAASGNATGNNFTIAFAVPQASAGNHTVKVTDVATRENATNTFAVTTSYSMKVDLPVKPLQLQENDSIPITVNITGGESSQTYIANVTVLTPANASYVQMVSLATSNLGSGVASVRFPDDFPSGANTQFVGNYDAFFNTTLAKASFFVGLTNSTEYHRDETVDIKAVYKPSETVNLTITGKDLRESVNVTADLAGIVRYSNFTVPLNASIGAYNVSIFSISPQPTMKSPPDTQNFTIPGFAVNVTAKNLAGDPVPSVSLQVFEDAKSVINATTDSSGLSSLKLEIGIYLCNASFMSTLVGQLEINVTGDLAADLVCNLTNLKISVVAVVDGTEVAIPEAGIYLTPNNKTSVTDITGVTFARSLLPNVTYTLNASRYGKPFGEITTIANLTSDGNLVPWFNVTIMCPTLTFQVTIVKTNGQPISNVVVKIQDVLGGLFNESVTGAEGTTSFTSAFGRYRVQVYTNTGIKLNETVVDLFQNQNTTVYCSLYGLTLSVGVTDYFGQPLANVNVRLQREGSAIVTGTTGSNGVATFSDVIGGNYEIAVFVGGQSLPHISQEYDVASSTTVHIRLADYISLAGALVETNYLVVAVIIALTAAFIVVLEIYRRRQVSKQKVESLSENK